MTERKRILFICACCRHSWDCLDDDGKKTIEFAELNPSLKALKGLRFQLMYKRFDISKKGIIVSFDFKDKFDNIIYYLNRSANTSIAKAVAWQRKLHKHMTKENL